MITDENVCTAPQRLPGRAPQNMAGNVGTCPLNIQWSESRLRHPFGGLVEILEYTQYSPANLSRAAGNIWTNIQFIVHFTRIWWFILFFDLFNHPFNFFYFIEQNRSSVFFSYTMIYKSNLESWNDRHLSPERNSRWTTVEITSSCFYEKLSQNNSLRFWIQLDTRGTANKSNSVKVWGVRTPRGASVSRSLSCLVIKSDFSENVNEAFDSGWLLLKLCASHAVLLLLPHVSSAFSTNSTSSSVSAHTLSNIFSICQKNIFIAVRAHITSVNSIRGSQLLSAAAQTPYRGLLNLPGWVCVGVCRLHPHTELIKSSHPDGGHRKMSPKMSGDDREQKLTSFKRRAVLYRRQTEAASIRQGELWSLGGGGNTQSGRRCLLAALSWISSVFVTTAVQSESVNQCELCSSAGDLLPPRDIIYSFYSCWST